MKRLLALSLLLVAMQPALAINNKKPNACPTVNALTSVGVNFAKQREPGIWDAYQLKHTYSTDSEWTFEMTAFISDSANAALAKANAAISKLDYYMGDQPTHYNDEWFCMYITKSEGEIDILGSATTPPQNPDATQNMISRYML